MDQFILIGSVLFRGVVFHFLASMTWELLCLKVYIWHFSTLFMRCSCFLYFEINCGFSSSFCSFERLLYLWWFTDHSSSGRMCQVDCIQGTSWSVWSSGIFFTFSTNEKNHFWVKSGFETPQSIDWYITHGCTWFLPIWHKKVTVVDQAQ